VPTAVSRVTLTTAYLRNTAESPEPRAESPCYTRPDMSGDARSSTVVPDSRSRTATYVAVILVEALVIAALYLFGRYFSA
jgi:hypothetical protein